MLWREFSNAIIKKTLLFKKGAVMKVTSDAGVETTLDLAELAALDSIGAADLAKIDGITNGTGAAGKALVLDSNGTVLMPAPFRYDHNTTITAFATGGQASATALTGEFNNVTTCATAGDSVKLPSAVGGESVTVKNSGAASLAVFPASGDSINALAVNLSINIPVGGEVTFRAISATVWETNEVLSVSAPTTQTGEFGIKATDNDADYEILLTNAAMAQSTVISIPDPGAATANVLLTDAANDRVVVTATAAELNYVDIASLGTGAASKAVVLDASGNYTMPTSGAFNQKAGGSTSTFVSEGAVSVQTTATGNAATASEGTLMSYSVPASVLNANGRGLYVKAWGTFAGNAQDKQIKLNVGGLIFASGTSTASGSVWKLEGEYVRTGSSAQTGVLNGQIGTTFVAPTQSTDTAVDTSTITVSVSAISGSASQSDVIQQGMIVRVF